ncbi:hypothetical protein [Aequorivita sediminis]|uniref:hypothetical protein n=1 Tax=Aequorivita sediminis TaxID=3073653 RepID=UPI0028A9EAEA|nr:hypothetical protein [Aequorivita sp. F6058]
MELYIEKEFLDNFFVEDKGTIQERVKKVFEDYGSKKVFIDIPIKDTTHLEQLKKDNEVFASICSNDKLPFSVDSIKEHLFEKSDFAQTLVFVNEDKDWLEDAENRGALCFTWKNYISKVESIVLNYHKEIDLIDKFVGWKDLDKIKNLPSNEVIIDDPYILTDTHNQKIKDNLIPLLISIFNNKSSQINTTLLTKFNDSNKYQTSDKITSKAKSIHGKLNSHFADFKVSFKIISTDDSLGYGLKFHDRIILTNFLKLECGEGFNLVPTKKSTSEIRIDSIFTKRTYDRMKKLKKVYNDYKNWIEKLESIHFKYYPE